MERKVKREQTEKENGKERKGLEESEKRVGKGEREKKRVE